MVERTLTPRLARLTADSDGLRMAVLRSNVLSTGALSALGEKDEDVAEQLGLSAADRPSFQKLFNLTKVRSDVTAEDRMGQMIDVLNGEGQLIMNRPRSDVHRLGLWHRVFNVWVICPSTWRVLVGQRSICKDVDPCRWTCVCGRVPSGELSRTAAVERLYAEFSISGLPEEKVSLAFSRKSMTKIEQGLFEGQSDCMYVDVYVAFLDEEIPVEKLYLDVRGKHAAKYIDVADLERAYAVRDEAFVLPTNDEYAKRLFHFLKMTSKEEHSSGCSAEVNAGASRACQRT